MLTKEEKESRAALVVEKLKARYPEAVCALNFGGDPWRLLVMGRLSAQCTDARVNEVSIPLFERYKTVSDFAEANPDELSEYIHSTGFFRNKTKNIIACCQKLIADFGGEVPQTMEELLTLPGVGRKTANLLLGDLYGKPGSVVCDTHCIRICGRLGLSVGKDPEKVETQLRAILPPEESSDFCHRIVLFGRDICTARNPQCHRCPLSMWCNQV